MTTTSSSRVPMIASRQPQDQAPNILQALMAVQQRIGYIPPNGIEEIARSLDVTEADVVGVASYYPEIVIAPRGRHVIRVCLGESCVANRCHRVLVALQDHLKVDLGQTTSDGRFTVEKVYCLGNCAVAPTVMIGEDIYGRVNGEQVLPLLERYL